MCTWWLTVVLSESVHRWEVERSIEVFSFHVGTDNN